MALPRWISSSLVELCNMANAKQHVNSRAAYSKPFTLFTVLPSTYT